MQSCPLVLIVDPDPLHRAAVSDLLRAEGMETEEHERAQAVLDACASGRGDCVVLESSLPDMGAVEFLTALRACERVVPALVLTGQGSVSLVVDTMKAGAFDFLEKPFDPQWLIGAVSSAIRARADYRRTLRRHADLTARLASLTGREREVLDRVVAGLANKQVAGELGISPKTVEIHRANVMRKMKARSLAELVRDWVFYEQLERDRAWSRVKSEAQAGAGGRRPTPRHTSLA